MQNVKAQNSKWDNPHKHQFPLKKKKKQEQKIDMSIFFNIPNLNWLKDYVKFLGQ